MFAARILAVIAATGASVPCQTLVKDFNTIPATQPGSSFPDEFLTLPSGELLFAANSPLYGRELWTTNGQVGGTRLAVDVNPGVRSSSAHQLVSLPSGLIVFVARTEGEGEEPWVTDGTQAGTRMLRDVYPGAMGSNSSGLTVAGNQVFFIARDDVAGYELWKTDGTSAGTQRVTELVPGPGSMNFFPQDEHMARLGANEVAFAAIIGNTWELWKSDGTAAGTMFVADIGIGSSSGLGNLTEFGSGVLFQGDFSSIARDVWVSDGTTAGTQPLGAVARGTFFVDGATAYFAGEQSPNDFELFRTDGTVAGTAQVADIYPSGTGGDLLMPRVAGSLGGRILYMASDDAADYDLHSYDPVAQQTVKLSEAGGFGLATPDTSLVLGGSLFFAGSLSGTQELWRTDGTIAGTNFVAAIDPYQLSGGVTGGVAVLRAEALGSGIEIWASDGTLAGTQLLVDLVTNPVNLSSDAKLLGRHRDLAFLHADDGTTGRELWVSDGTAAGTQLLLDATPGSGSTFSFKFVSTDSYALLSASGSNSSWITNGTPQGTTPLDFLSIGVTPSWRPEHRATLGGAVVFRGSGNGGQEPWITDGTLAGTRQLFDVNPGQGGSDTADFYTWGERVLFRAYSGSLVGDEPWITDGTTAGTFLLADVSPGPNDLDAIEYFAFGDLVYFASGGDPGSDSELWRTDGTSAGTQLAVDVVPGPVSSRPRMFSEIGGRLMFLASINGEQRFVSTDGTQLGTIVLPDLPGTEERAVPIGNDRGLVATVAQDGSRDGWITDGLTWFGPLSAFGLSPGETAPEALDDLLLLSMYQSESGQEQWTTDGTPAGTRLAVDSSLASSNPEGMIRLGDRVLFVGFDDQVGRELFSYPVSLLGDESVANFGFGCPGTNGAVPTLDVEGEANASAVVPFELVVDQARPLSSVILVYSRVTAAAPIPGCTLWIGGNLQLAFNSTNATGRSSYPFAPNPGLVGQRFASQAFVLDPQGAAFGIASATPALDIVVGP